MEITQLSDDAVVVEVGARLRAERLNQNLSQADLAASAGLSRRTVANAEKGEGCTLGTLVAMLRGLGRLDSIDAFLPAPGLSPVELAKRAGLPRQRASNRDGVDAPAEPWTWGDDPA
jgi:transcriptional regulator with XRE-family HTH domain